MIEDVEALDHLYRHVEIKDPDWYRPKMKDYIDPKEIYFNFQATRRIFARDYLGIIIKEPIRPIQTVSSGFVRKPPLRQAELEVKKKKYSLNPYPVIGIKVEKQTLPASNENSTVGSSTPKSRKGNNDKPKITL